MVRIILTGFRGTGKTRVGELLAHMLDVPFLDTDTLIEKRVGMTIYEIFQKYGEEYFRKKECETIASLDLTDSVVSTGGGAIMDPSNVAALRQGSTVFLLTADDRTIEQRIARTERPALTRLPLREEIHELQTIRRPSYIAAADFCINTTRKNANETALVIRHILAEGTTTGKDGAGFLSFVRKTEISRDETEALEGVLASPGHDPLTRIYAIAGNPCNHSLSPLLFNRLFSQYRMNCHYTRLCWPDFSEIVREAKKTDIRGLSVTIPFKTEALASIDEADEHVKAIGAANTLVLCEGTTFGFNTDWIGIRDPLSHLAGSRVAVIGAGGAAAAALYALQSLDMDITILARTPAKAGELSERFSVPVRPLSGFSEVNPDVVINATPVGMGDDSRSPVNVSLLKRGMTVYDLVYTPADTPLLVAARKAGCITIPGTEMFVRQACAQFRCFTGIEVLPAVVRGYVI
jgi:shikimate dehydrogenase